MNGWFHVVQAGIHYVEGGKAASLLPSRPTFIWSNTAYYAGKFAERFFKHSRMDMIVLAVPSNFPFPEVAVELVDKGDEGVVAVPLRNARERTDERPVCASLRKTSLAKQHVKRRDR